MTPPTIKAFNNQLKTFTTILSDRFPDIFDLKLAKTGIKAVCKVSKKTLIDLFVKYTYQYRDLVMNKDETALLNTDFSKNVDKNDAEYTVKIISIIRDNWKQLSVK
jgi:hypothetical protein